MQLINFDKHFAEHLHNWIEKNADVYPNADDMEAAVPFVYNQFLDTAQPWLDGQKPGTYFLQYDDAKLLIAWMLDYHHQKVDMPDMLLNRIVQLPQSAPLLMALLSDNSPLEVRMLAIELLRQMESTLPLDTFIGWLLDDSVQKELIDSALESLDEMGQQAVPALLKALPQANEDAKEGLLSILSRYPGTPNVAQALAELFTACPKKRAVLAAYMGRFGDQGALPLLMDAAQQQMTPYLDYIELRSAIEALGGDAPQRNYEDDPDYDALFGYGES